MATASHNPNFRRPLLRATPLSAAPQVSTPPPVPVALPPLPPPPSVVPSPDRTIAAQLKIDALNKKAKAASGGFLAGVLAIVVLVFGECGPREPGLYNENFDRNWFVKVENPRDPFFPSILGLAPVTYHSEFSLQKFLTNWVGWLVIFLCVGCAANLAALAKYTNAAKAVSDQNQGTVC